MSKLRVLFVAGLTPNNGGLSGGQGTVAQAICHSALQEHVEFEVLSTTMRSLPPPPLLARAAAALRRTIRFGMRIRRNDVALIFSSDGFSLVEKSVMCMIARWFGRGVVLRTSAGGLRPQVGRSALIRWFLRRALKNANVICSQGQSWTAFFKQFPEARDKIVEIPNAVDLPPFSVRPRTKRILYVGWLVKAKGIYDLVQTFAQVQRRVPEVVLDVVGGGGEAGSLAKELSGFGNACRMHGWLPRERVFELMSDSAVLVLPSYSEGLPNVVLEAMAAGTPVIATQVGALPDVIRDNENGFLAAPGAVAKMAGDIERLLADASVAQRIARAAFSTAQRFQIENVWPQYLELLTRAAIAAGRNVEERAPDAMRAQGAKG